MQNMVLAEAALEEAYKRYIAAYDAADEAYSDAFCCQDQMSYDLASDQLYMDQLEADLEFWDSADYWSKLLGVVAWSRIGISVGTKVATKTPLAQARIAALVAVVGFMQAEATSRAITARKEHYQTLINKQKEAIDWRTKILFWQNESGGTGQPAPNSDLEDLFPGCLIQSTCIEAWVCSKNGKALGDCEKNTICEDRLVRC